MTPAAGSRLGPYEVVAPIGRGGMGEVFRARDTRIGREVALKVLSGSACADEERFRRFELEARAAGALSHPNVVVLHDVGTEAGVPYLVSELLEGETLADRLRRGALAPRRAVEIAIEVASALAAAHEKGIVHRDLKPENVFLTADGQTKVLDFGLAKLLGDGPPGAKGGSSGPETRSDIVVGTAGYMAPEQVRGEELDGRADVFALGTCLYEMLTGRRAFGAGSAVETMAAILLSEPPDLTSLRQGIPIQLERIVRRCLEKQRGARFQSARDLAFALESLDTASLPAEPGRAGATVRLRGRGGRSRLLGPAAFVAAGAVAGFAGAFALRGPAAEPPPALRTLTHSGVDSQPAASPDGSLVAFSSRRGGRSRIWLKQVRGEGETALTTGPGDSLPRFFPDGQSLLFTRTDGSAGPSLWRVPLVGGAERRLFSAAEAGDVSPDGTEVAFLRLLRPADRATALLLGPVAGGEARELARFDTVVASPRFSPDGETIALSEEGSAQSGVAGSIVLVGRDGRVRRLPLPLAARQPTAVAWLSSGESLLAGVFDASVPHARTVGLRVLRMPASGGDAQVVAWWPSAGRTLDVLAEGRVVFDSVATRESLYEVPLGRAGPVRWLTHGTATDRQPVYSPDGKRILFSSDRSGQLDLWVLERETGALRRVTDDAAQDWDPAFSPDGRRILWSSDRSGRFEVWTSGLDGTDARRLTRGEGDAENPVLTPDGGMLLWGSLERGRGGIWRARPDGSGAKPLVRGQALQLPEVSPDGRWVAFREGIGTGPRAIRIVGLADGAEVASIVLPEVVDPVTAGESGRSRWMPDGRLAFVGVDAQGVAGVFAQEVVAGVDTTATRLRLGGFDPTLPAESFAISPDGAWLVVAARESLSSVVLAEPVAGAGRPRSR
ncbi:MAG: protein kinase domain-containing protein [Thermoanaerobaculia bacterium]